MTSKENERFRHTISSPRWLKQRSWIWFIESITVFTLCALAIGVATWPWLRNFTMGMPDHFDPPFHAWKLRLIAEHLHQGHLLPPDGNSNVYFPHGLSLYFDALLWPQSLFAAILFLFTNNAILVYNLVSLSFWALSGLFMFWLLRQAKLTKTAALTGGILFCVLPYRVSYIVEFNMEQCAGIVLFLLFLMRFAEKPDWKNGLGLAFAFWLQAASELYQALFLVILFPLLAAPFVTRMLQEGCWRRRSFFAGCAAAIVAAMLLGLIFLAPYSVLNQVDGFSRLAKETSSHHLEPLSYLLHIDQSPWIPAFSAQADEMSVYPTVIVLLLALWHAAATNRLRPRFSNRNASRTPTRDARRRLFSVSFIALRWLRVGVILTAGGILLSRIGAGDAPHPTLSTVLNVALLLFVVSSALIALEMRKDRRAQLTAALAAAAALSFVLSLGPTIEVYEGPFAAPNELFWWFVKRVPLMQGMRVVSRFSIIVMVFLTVTAACGFDRIVRRFPRLHSGAALLVILMVIIESRQAPLHFAEVMDHLPARLSSALAATEVGLGCPRPIAAIPFGSRYADSRHMLAIARSDRLLVNGWGGFIPDLQRKLAVLNAHGTPEAFMPLLSSVWPDPLLLIDRTLTTRMGGAWPNTCEQLRQMGTVLYEDPRYLLIRPELASTPVPMYQRLTRADVLKQHRRIHVRLRCAAADVTPVEVWVTVNGAVLTRDTITTEWHDFRWDVPDQYIAEITPNRICLTTPSGLPMEVKDFSLEPASVSSPGGRPLNQEPWSQTHSAVGHVTALPPTAVPCRVQFDNGATLEAVELDPRTAAPGDTVHVRYFWTCARRLTARQDLFVWVHFRLPSDETVFYDDHVLLQSVATKDILIQPYTKFFIEDRLLTIPPDAPLGVYTMRLGLYLRERNIRLDGRSNLPVNHRAFRLPISLQIVDRPTEMSK